MILSGVPVRTEHVHRLAVMLEGDELATKLDRAIANDNSIVGLSVAEREKIRELLAVHAPSGLAELHATLVKQLKQRNDRAAQEERSRLSQLRSAQRKEDAS
jgi:hypothetical protein